MGGTSLNTAAFPSGGLFSTGITVGVALDTGARSLVGNGGVVVTDTSAAALTGTVGLGLQGDVNIMYGTIIRATFWNSKLTDATLQALTRPDLPDLQNALATTVGRGVVTAGATTSSVPTSGFSIANAAASGVVSNQFASRAVLFDGNTTTAGLQGAAGTIIASTASNTPTFTLATALPATPVSGDTFSVI